ncbi:MAG: hypothetical protein ACRC23_02025 [Aeromonas jandaei]
MSNFVLVRFKKINDKVVSMEISKQGSQKKIYALSQSTLDERRLDVETYEKVKGNVSHFECEYNDDTNLIVEIFLVREVTEYLSTVIEEIKNRLLEN